MPLLGFGESVSLVRSIASIPFTTFELNCFTDNAMEPQDALSFGVVARQLLSSKAARSRLTATSYDRLRSALEIICIPGSTFGISGVVHFKPKNVRAAMVTDPV